MTNDKTLVANDEDAEALHRLGDFYYYGKGGLPVDARKAVEYLTKAAELGDLESYNFLGEIYCNSEGGVEADGYKALEFFSKAENWSRVAEIYRDGKGGVKQDGYKAIEFFAKAEDWSSIALIYRDGTGGVVQSGSKAIEYFTRDFEENDAYDSGNEVLQIYLYGCGEIKPDWRKAFEFANVPSGGGLEFYDYDTLAFKFVCVFDDKLGYFRKDGLGTLQVLERRVKRLESLKAPNIVIANELRRIAEIYEEGYGGLAPNLERRNCFGRE